MTRRAPIRRAPARRAPARRALALVATVALAGGLLAVGLGPVTPPRPALAATTSLQYVATAASAPYATWNPGANRPDTAFSSPAVGDVTGDGNPDLVTGGMDGCVRTFTLAGAPEVGCMNTGSGPIEASPLLVDWNGDGVLDIVAANEGNGLVFVFDGQGNWLWSPHGDAGPFHGIFGTPAVGDVNRDGQLDIVATSWDQHVYAWSHNGALLPGFPRFLFDTLWSSPVLADIDNDGWLEIVFGGDMDYGNGANLPPYNLAPGGVLWVLNPDGSNQPGFPKSLPGQVIWSTPSVADINNDGTLDIVVGTGNNWDEPANHPDVYAFNNLGQSMFGWPAYLGGTSGGRSMGSPALGDVNGDGSLEVATQTDDGRITVLNTNGSVRWSACNMSNAPCDGRTFAGVNGGVVMADVDGDGRQEVVAATEQTLRIFDASNGAVEASAALPYLWAPGSHPTVARVGGDTYIFVTGTVDNGDGHRGLGDRQQTWIFRTGHALGSGGWPTFKNNMRRTGTLLDSTPPTAGLGGLAASQTSTKISVAWLGSDAPAQGEVASGVASFDVDAKDGTAPRVRWLDHTTANSASYYGIAGHTTKFWVRARDRAGNVGAWSGPVSTTIAAGATRAQPFSVAYTAARYGWVGSLSSPPVDGPSFPFDIARGLAVRSTGGGYVADGWGGLHPFGGAPTLPSPGYWVGWDIVRGLALNADGSGYLLDGWGGLHPIGGALKPANAPYFPGMDVARGIALLPTSTKNAPAGYILDAYGGLHRFGSAPKVTDGPYWPGWQIVRGFALDPEGPGGYEVDAFGGLHPFGGAPPVAAGGYWVGWDIARAVGLVADGAAGKPEGYVLDGFGGLHAFGGAPALAVGSYWGSDVARFLSIAP